MRRVGWLISLFCIVFSANSFAETLDATIGQLQSQRQAFAQDNKIDLQQLSREIQATVKESNTLDFADNDAEAIKRLLVLQKYAPLAEFPSYDVQMLCAKIYTKLGNGNDADACRERAAALTEILQKRSGSGATPDDPVQVVTISEIGEWIGSISAKVSDIKAYPYHNVDLQAITYSGPTTGGKAALVYFSLTPRLVELMKNAKTDIFAPLPVSPADGKYQAALDQARGERIRFLNDTSFNYPELIQFYTNAEREAMRLEQQGDINGALSKIREIEKIRPIREIPTFDLISNYSFLLGKSGDINGQINMRLYLFGITQDIAHSGNGLTPDTAVHVIAVSEEYAWLHEKNLRVTRQSLIKIGNHRYDAMDATDGSGNSKTVYFDVSQVYIRASPVPVQ